MGKRVDLKLNANRAQKYKEVINQILCLLVYTYVYMHTNRELKKLNTKKTPSPADNCQTANIFCDFESICWGGVN